MDCGKDGEKEKCCREEDVGRLGHDNSSPLFLPFPIVGLSGIYENSDHQAMCSAL